jgi:hypothetical protein
VSSQGIKTALLFGEWVDQHSTGSLLKRRNNKRFPQAMRSHKFSRRIRRNSTDGFKDGYRAAIGDLPLVICSSSPSVLE